MNKKLTYMMLCLSLFAFGCNDWLDVQPKSQVKEEDLFSSESGFRDALTGIYALMGRVETYGGNSTMGFMDMLAQTYSKVDYDYEDALKYKSMSRGLWIRCGVPIIMRLLIVTTCYKI